MNLWARIALVGLGALALGPLGARAQVGCNQQTTGALLAQFSDTAAPGSITPANLRNVVCSSPQALSPGASAQAQALTSSPFAFAASVAGTLYVSSGAVTVTRAGITMTPGVLGGAFPLLTSDTVTVSWFSTVVPSVTFLPVGQ